MKELGFSPSKSSVVLWSISKRNLNPVSGLTRLHSGLESVQLSMMSRNSGIDLVFDPVFYVIILSRIVRHQSLLHCFAIFLPKNRHNNAFE